MTCFTSHIWTERFWTCSSPKTLQTDYDSCWCSCKCTHKNLKKICLNDCALRETALILRWSSWCWSCRCHCLYLWVAAGDRAKEKMLCITHKVPIHVIWRKNQRQSARSWDRLKKNEIYSSFRQATDLTSAAAHSTLLGDIRISRFKDFALKRQTFQLVLQSVGVTAPNNMKSSSFSHNKCQLILTIQQNRVARRA